MKIAKKFITLICLGLSLSLIFSTLSNAQQLKLLKPNSLETPQENLTNQSSSYLIASSSWYKMSGEARDVGDNWVIGTTPDDDGYKIYRWNGYKWEEMPGSGVRIGGNKDNPLVVNSNNEIFRWEGSQWRKMPGEARDVGDDWVIGTNPAKGGYKIYRWKDSNWQEMPGGAVRIGGNRYNPWVVNVEHEIFTWVGSDWRKIPGRATDVANNWIISNEPTEGGYKIYRWNGSSWDQSIGGAVNIGGDRNNPLVVNDENEIFKLR